MSDISRFKSLNGFFIEVFTSPTCHNCSPVKSFCSQLQSIPGIDVLFIDCGDDSGLKQAEQKCVQSIPTVIVSRPAADDSELFIELGRFSTVKALDSFLSSYLQDNSQDSQDTANA